MNRKQLFSVLVTFALALVAAHPAEFNHTALDAILKKNVRDGWVNYTALKADPKPLNSYLDALAAVPEKDFNGWPERERLAFLINLYNAATMKLIVDHYPVKSIKDIGGFLGSPWKQEVVRLFGKVTTLHEIEHGIIRKQYSDARAHFALVCAAKGCPPLRTEAFLAARLDEQLDDQGRVFLGQTHKNHVDAGSRTLHLSPIFKWFSEDFEKQSGSVLKFVTPFFDDASRQALTEGKFNIRFTDYDWSLNDGAAK
ncbi:MAG: DUF547 domain-containing protein [Limisphaerales bacterium]